ncbi:MAG: hypothetical protein ABI895_17535 [Deltaproteobacteria bacterium]
MSDPRSDSEELSAQLSQEALSQEALSPEALSQEEGLSPENAELLSFARQQRRAQRAPEDLRQRARARALAELAGPAAAHAMPAAPLIAVTRPSLRFGLRLFAVAALVLGAIVGAPALLRTVSEQLAQGPEPRSSGNWQVSGPAGELLSRGSPLLRLPLLPLPEEEPPVLGPSLLGERPFAQPGGTWQVRRWNDPKAAPDEPAAYGFEDGALCVTLATGERVLGGWPWPTAGAASPGKVSIVQGRAYRLAFRAWVRGPLPSQVLLGVGHIQFPFVAAAAARVQIAPEPERFAMDFVASQDDEAVGVAFLASNGPHTDSTRVCLADVTLVAR